MAKNWKKTHDGRYKNIRTGENISRTTFNNRIKNGNESKDYEIYDLNGKKFPRSKKDKSEGNNLT
jgi:hypothetical protein